MPDLPSPDSHHLSAAAGWLELNCPADAQEELAKIAPEFQTAAPVLETRWAVCAGVKNWEAALSVAEVLVEKFPGRPVGWIHRAYALRRATGGGLRAAWDALLPAFEMFPREPVIPYNLACYAAQLDQPAEAMEWWQRALASAPDVKQLKEMALADVDLQALWDRIQAL